MLTQAQMQRYSNESGLRDIMIADWDDFRQLLNRAVPIDRDRITADCVRGFRFLADLTPDERSLAADAHQREQALWGRLRTELATARPAGKPQAVS